MSTQTASVPGDGDSLFAPARVAIERRADASIILRSPVALRPPARCVGEWLEHWARVAPLRTFLAERPAADRPWSAVAYGEALARVRAIGAWLLARRLSAERPVAILSDNGVEHALLALAGMHVGVSVATISPAYSLMSRDHAKLKAMIGLLRPGVIYASDSAAFAPALNAIRGCHDAVVVAGGAAGAVPPADLGFPDIERTADPQAVARAFAAITPETIARFLFTSGSTGEPKAVVNTQRMLCSNQEAKAQVWPMLEREPPVILDWLPWSHTFGANHNFNLVLRNGGTLHIDAGKPAPHLFPTTLANLRDICPTICFNVPRGYDMLVAALVKDEALRRRFFSGVRIIFYAGAALPQNLWEDLERLSLETVGRKTPMVSAWGSTETAPLATDCHFQAARSGNIGVPVPGTELKLVPGGDKLEIRVRGPNVTPGYWKRPDLTREAFDEEGFYRIGDAVRFVDPQRPEQGLLFDGRIAEDFKLTTGTWVNVGTLRVKGIAALAPVAQDIVVTGHGRHEIGFLVFPNVAACHDLSGLPAGAPVRQVLDHPAVRRCVRDGLAHLRDEGGGSSTYATRALLMDEPPSVDAGEITDKGYINQRAVLARRPDLVALMENSDSAIGL